MSALRKIILEDGSVYHGQAFGSEEQKILELVFNTSMVGYQEILSDPSYTDQAVVMTYPLIGNYGMNDDDYETKVPSIGAFIVREYNDEPSNFRTTATLSEIMKLYNIAGVSGIDTRELTRKIRTVGSCKVMICDESVPDERALAELTETELRHDQVERVSTPEIWESTSVEHKYRVVAVDCGMKLNIVRSLNKRGCDVTIVPWNTPAEKILEMNPDGLFLSNGPGDPTDVTATIETVRALIGKLPIFGICLGHQILSLAHGAKTYKLKFGHRGGNHPVKDISTDKLEITSQNHSFAVDDSSISGTGLTVTHINLLDNTVEGVENREAKAFSIQYHPESAPGPQDSAYLFDRFISWMEEKKNA